jgi:ABC-type polysaccharide/polyol phosphate transport system ATPase subunit
MAHIRLQQVVIDFPIANSSSQSLQLRLVQALGGRLASHHSTVVVRALDGVDLELNDGDRLGIVGHNGSGKTTLLRVLAGVYPPDPGFVAIEGSISSFTDITLGMDPESTGLENIVFRCAFMGLSFEQARKLTPAIAEFSELGSYLDLPTRTYSTGMFMRLAFAISTAIEPDILIMDEMISSGDSRFIDKAKRRLQQLISKANILALASHDMDLIRNICNKVAWMEHGVMKECGAPNTITAAYEKYSSQADVVVSDPRR